MVSREQIDKNIKILRWKIGRADPDVVQQLTCCLVRSMLIYIGTPMVAAGVWKRSDIDRIEASLYRKVMRIGNNITNNAILNTLINIRLAREVVSYLSKGAQDEFRRQNRVTKYFEAIRENENNGGDTEMAAQGIAGGAAQGRSAGSSRQYQPPPRREKIYVPKNMMDTMLSATGNGTSIHFGFGHCCRKHNRLFTLDHIE